MTTIPSRLAQTTYISKSLDEAKRRSVAMYRNFYRSVSTLSLWRLLKAQPVSKLKLTGYQSLSHHATTYPQAPEICALYALEVPPSKLRAKFRTQFEKNKMINDIAVLDLM